MGAEVDDRRLPEDEGRGAPSGRDAGLAMALPVAQDRVIDELVSADQASRHARAERRRRAFLSCEGQADEPPPEVVPHVDGAGCGLDAGVVDKLDAVAAGDEVSDASRLLMRRELPGLGRGRERGGRHACDCADQTCHSECLLHDSSLWPCSLDCHRVCAGGRRRSMDVR
jgi:hypothetical protein